MNSPCTEAKMTVSLGTPGAVGARSEGIVQVSKTNLLASVSGWIVPGRRLSLPTTLSGVRCRFATRLPGPWTRMRLRPPPRYSDQTSLCWFGNLLSPIPPIFFARVRNGTAVSTWNENVQIGAYTAARDGRSSSNAGKNLGER